VDRRVPGQGRGVLERGHDPRLLNKRPAGGWKLLHLKRKRAPDERAPSPT
jgi:hypothetical protein